MLCACLDLVKACKCEDGCPSCVGAPVPPFAQNDPDLSPRGRIPDKEAALVILHDLLEKGTYVPKPVEKRVAAGPGAMPDATPGAVGLQGDHDQADVIPLPVRRLPESIEARLRRQLARIEGR